jgi:hypothetical protein
MRRILAKIKSQKNEQGIALVVVLLALTIISILGLSIMGLAVNNTKMSSSERTYQSTYYIAESGVTYKINKINTNIVDIYHNSDDASTFFLHAENMLMNLNNDPPYKNFEDSFGHKPEAKVTIEKIDTSNWNSLHFRDYKITSVGTINNRSRTVEKHFRITWKPKTDVIIPDTAVFIKDSINLSGGAKIIGGAGTNSSAPSSINLDGGASISGDIYVGPDSGNSTINKPNWMELDNEIIKLAQAKTFEMPEFPSFPSYPIPEDEKVHNSTNSYNVINDGSLHIDSWMTDNYTLTMTENMQFNEIRITSNYTLNINVGDNDRAIVVNNLHLPNGKININGTGKLTIYVNNNITMGAGSVINTNDQIENSHRGRDEQTRLQLIKDHVKKLEVFYKGSNLNLSGDQKIYGSLYAKNAELTLTGGSGFQGHLLLGGGEIEINGGANAVTQLFYAPNSDVIMSGGGTIKGSIIAQSYTATGGSSVTFDSLNPNDLPPILAGTSEGAYSAEDIISAEPSREK